MKLRAICFALVFVVLGIQAMDVSPLSQVVQRFSRKLGNVHQDVDGIISRSLHTIQNYAEGISRMIDIPKLEEFKMPGMQQQARFPSSPQSRQSANDINPPSTVTIPNSC